MNPIVEPLPVAPQPPPVTDLSAPPFLTGVAEVDAILSKANTDWLNPAEFKVLLDNLEILPPSLVNSLTHVYTGLYRASVDPLHEVHIQSVDWPSVGFVEVEVEAQVYWIRTYMNIEEISVGGEVVAHTVYGKVFVRKVEDDQVGRDCILQFKTEFV